ncbi:MAG: DUF2339 domain-containing protein [Phycisphaerales bacterium]
MGEHHGDSSRAELQALRAEMRSLAARLEALERTLDHQPAEDVGQQPAEVGGSFNVDGNFEAEVRTELEEEGGGLEEQAAEQGAVSESEPEIAQKPRSMYEELIARRERAYGRERPAPPIVPPLARPPSPAGFEDDPRPKRTLSDLEWLVGAKGIVLVGVLILVIAAGLFLKEAWDRGWVDQVPGWLRCSIGGLFGLALVAVGEVVRRKINPLASSGVIAAGLAIVFGSILAASRLYELLPLPAAFALLAMTSLAGVLMGALSSRVLLSSLSLGGAFVVPLVLRSDTPSFVIMPAYLISLLGMGLALAGWKGHEFAIIRRIAWWGTAVLGTMWSLTVLDRSAASPAVFAGVVWAMTIAELVVSSRFFARLRPSIDWPARCTIGFIQDHGGDPITLDLNEMVSPVARWINSSFGVTAWAAVLAGFAIHRHAPGLAWLSPASLAAASLALAFWLSPNRPKLWAREGSARSVLATAMTVNAAGLLAATITTALGGPAEVVAWSIVGLAAVVFGWSMRFHASAVLGLAFIGVAVGRLFTYDIGQALLAWEDGSLATVSLLGLHFSTWSAQVALVAATVAVSAVLLRASPYRVPVAMGAIAAVGASGLGPGSHALSRGASWTAYGAALACVGARVRRFDVRVASLVSLIGGTVLAGLYALSQLADAPPPRVTQLFIDWNNASWALSIAALSWLVWTVRRGQTPVWRAVGVVVAFGSVVLAIEGDGVPLATSLIAWTVMVGFVLGLSALSDRPAKRSGLGPLHRWMLPQIAVGLAVLLAVVWLGERAWTDWGEIEAVAWAHRAMVSAVLIIAALVFGGWQVGRARRVPLLAWDQADSHRVMRIVSWSGAGVMAFAASSSEVFRVVEWIGAGGDAAPDAALSVWWSLFAVATIAVGMRWKLPALRWTGLALLAATSAKVIAIDMAALDGLTRIAGSTVVGLILLAAGAGYAWVMGKARESVNAEP